MTQRPWPLWIRVVGPLDSRQHRSYRLTVRLTDTHNDLDPAKRRSCLCTVTVHVQVRVKTPLKEHLVITRMEAVWHPPAWFMAVLTVSGALLLAALGCMARSLLYVSAQSKGAALMRAVDAPSPWDSHGDG
uniref:Uncharacterized protein n=1 Tax=Melopsittacus undulatus TaxID=13146 RepID=A0A8C6INR8_MELUD